MSPASTEILFALGVGKDIVCRDQFSNFPEEAKGIPQLMGHQKVSGAALKNYEPTLVLTETVIQEKLAGQLRSENFPVVHQDPRTFAEVLESIAQLGILVEREEQAKALMTTMLQELTALKNKAKLLTRKPRIYIEEWHEPPMASGNWVPELVIAAGGIPFPIKAGELSRAVTLQEVQTFDPDLIVISWCARPNVPIVRYGRGAGLTADKNLLLHRSEWDSLRAVQQGRVKVIDDSYLNRPGPRLVEGSKRLYGWLAEAVFSS